MKNFGRRNGNFETSAVVKNQGTKQRGPRITSKELAPLHSLKNGILQSACSTSPRMDADFGKSALMRIARLMNSLAKSSKLMVIKVQWLC